MRPSGKSFRFVRSCACAHALDIHVHALVCCVRACTRACVHACVSRARALMHAHQCVAVARARARATATH